MIMSCPNWKKERSLLLYVGVWKWACINLIVAKKKKIYKDSLSTPRELNLLYDNMISYPNSQIITLLCVKPLWNDLHIKLPSSYRLQNLHPNVAFIAISSLISPLLFFTSGNFSHFLSFFLIHGLMDWLLMEQKGRLRFLARSATPRFALSFQRSFPQIRASANFSSSLDKGR